MARLAGGFGTAHSPQLCIPPEGWRPHGELFDLGGRLDRLAPSTRSEAELRSALEDDVIAARHHACTIAMARLHDEVKVLAPAAIVIVGDDERELFSDSGMPTLAVYWGKTIDDLPPGPDRYPPTMRSAYEAYHADEPESYEVAADLGLHMIERLVEDGFDPAQLSVQPEGRSVGHAFTFVRRRILGSACPPIVPLLLNTYYPPNQPTVSRCIALGRSLRAAVASWDADADVLLCASGGLSHPIVDEELDRSVLEALAAMDEERLLAIPGEVFVEGTSEIKNWIVVGAALEHQHLEVIDYVPAYRSLAGSGCGMAFAVWRP
jgi:hypothetical protein